MTNDTIQQLKDLENSLLKRRDKAKQELISTEKDLEMVRDVIKKMGKKPAADGKTDDREIIPTEYKMNMHQEKKVAYILRKLKEGDVKDISEHMHQLEKDSDYDSIYRRVQQVVIRMKKQMKITGTGDYGSKYKLNVEKYNI